MPNDIQQQVAADLGISDLPEAQQEEMIAKFGAIALQASTIAVLEAMAPDKREAFTKLVETGDQTAAAKFLQDNCPDHESIARQAVAAEIQKFKDFQKTV